MKKRTWLRGALLALALCGGMSLSSAWAATTLVINTYLPPKYPLNSPVLKSWADDVERVTEGRVKIVIPPASLAAPQQLWEAVTSGVVDGAYIFNGNFYRQLPLMQIAHLPLGSTSASGMSMALWRTYQRYFKAAGEYKDVELLALFVFPGGQLYGLKHPITSLNDLQGHKMWALPGVAAQVMEAAGAGVMSTPAAKISEIVASGMVDGFAGIPEMDAGALKVLRYAKFETVVPGALTSPSFSLILNKKKWQAISAEDRAAITEVSGEAFARRLAVFDQMNAGMRKKAAADGLQVSEASPQFMDELKRLATPLENAWLARAMQAHVDGAAALAFYRQQAARSGQ